MDQSIMALAGFHNYIAASSAVAAGRPAAWHKLFPTKRQTAIAAVAGLYTNRCFINKHCLYSILFDLAEKGRFKPFLEPADLRPGQSIEWSSCGMRFGKDESRPVKKCLSGAV